ncbi:MAG TPA: hypothetical protein VFA10_20130 [Ktedonobacteraceae bacterium]|nr:hypothetical protein [Ktedonobacteraceae bacterium]
MAMMISSHQRTWDTDDRQLQGFLGLSLWEPETNRPRFGAGVKAPLRKRSLETMYELVFDPEGEVISGGEGGEEVEDTLLTNLKLAWHFGHMDWAVENAKHLLRKSKGAIQMSDIDERFFLAAQNRAIAEFVARRVIPLSRAAMALEYPLYVQSVPARIIEMDLPTSRFFARTVERSLCTLPATLRSAEHYQLTESEIHLLAPQVIWVINYRCSTHSILLPEKLRDAIDEWRPFVDPALLSDLYERSQKNRPYLLSEDVKQRLIA